TRGPAAARSRRGGHSRRRRAAPPCSRRSGCARRRAAAGRGTPGPAGRGATGSRRRCGRPSDRRAGAAGGRRGTHRRPGPLRTGPALARTTSQRPRGTGDGAAPPRRRSGAARWRSYWCRRSDRPPTRIRGRARAASTPRRGSQPSAVPVRAVSADAVRPARRGGGRGRGRPGARPRPRRGGGGSARRSPPLRARRPRRRGATCGADAATERGAACVHLSGRRRENKSALAPDPATTAGSMPRLKLASACLLLAACNAPEARPGPAFREPPEQLGRQLAPLARAPAPAAETDAPTEAELRDQLRSAADPTPAALQLTRVLDAEERLPEALVVLDQALARRPAD